MAFRRLVTTSIYATHNDLSASLVGIGFKIGGKIKKNPNIEDTLIAAAIEGLNGDYRVLSILVDWFEIHYERVNVDRLARAVKLNSDPKVKAFFAGVGRWLKKDSRFKRLQRVYIREAIPLTESPSYKFLIQRNGEDERFKGSKFLVARGNLRHRLEDVLTPRDLAKLHKDYYYRALIGPSYRADMISIALREKDITAAELARKSYGSFATAWQVLRDIRLLDNQIRKFRINERPESDSK